MSVVPIGTVTTSLSKWVAHSLRVLEEYPHLQYELTPMGTVIEGNLDQALRAARNMHETPFQAGAKRVVTTISIDDRRDKRSTSCGKVKAVMNKLKE